MSLQWSAVIWLKSSLILYLNERQFSWHGYLIQLCSCSSSDCYHPVSQHQQDAWVERLSLSALCARCTFTRPACISEAWNWLVNFYKYFLYLTMLDNCLLYWGDWQWRHLEMTSSDQWKRAGEGEWCAIKVVGYVLTTGPPGCPNMTIERKYDGSYLAWHTYEQSGFKFNP